MTATNWLPLTEYSSKFKVSISTLRRRIKAGQVDYSIEDGKYLLKNLPLNEHRNSRVTFAPPQMAKGHPEPKKSAHEEIRQIKKPTDFSFEGMRSELVSMDFKEEPVKAPPSSEVRPTDSPVLTTANRLLDELKKAYMLILQEKEEQILQLREELTDLKTLVRVLENENERIKINMAEAAPIDSWLSFPNE